jgi:hypothetical protein
MKSTKKLRAAALSFFIFYFYSGYKPIVSIDSIEPIVSIDSIVSIEPIVSIVSIVSIEPIASYRAYSFL